MDIKPWRGSDCDTRISLEEVQIWSAFFDDENYSHFFHLLSEDEKNRAVRLKNPRTACQQIISRGILRILLGNYIGINPKELIFNNNPFGKPFLSNPVDSEICFNLTHSGNMLLIAIRRGKQIGVDVEKIEEKIDYLGVSSQVFSSDEQLFLTRSVNPIHAFYRLWTAKEAFLKGTGLGFSYPSSQFSVVISKGITSISKIPKDFASAFSCSMSSFSPASGYSAALAIMP